MSNWNVVIYNVAFAILQCLSCFFKENAVLFCVHFLTAKWHGMYLAWCVKIGRQLSSSITVHVSNLSLHLQQFQSVILAVTSCCNVRSLAVTVSLVYMSCSLTVGVGLCQGFALSPVTFMGRVSSISEKLGLSSFAAAGLRLSSWGLTSISEPQFRATDSNLHKPQSDEGPMSQAD